MAIIENDLFKIVIRNQGGELTSFYNKKTGVEHLWQADPAIWGWHAPNLFPIVGQLIDNELLVDGEKYELPRHGFNRTSELLLLKSDEQSAWFSLPYCEKTLAKYPYKFDFQIHYDLIDDALRVTYKVINLDKKPIYFSVGGHPAFNVPFNKGERYEDYYFEFEVDEKLETHLLTPAGVFNDQTEPVATQNGKLFLTRDMFAKDALVFKNLQSRVVSIKSTQHDQTLTVEFPHFNYLGLWAKPGADFVCIEPWLGCADSEGKHVDISQKEAIQKLGVGHVFEAAYFLHV
jgi:galactose mutarotase-like enzyme